MTHTEDRPEPAPQDELGQTMAEYGILVSLISVALIVVLSVGGVGGALAGQWANIVTAITDAFAS